MAVGNQSAEYVDEEINHAAVARVFDPGNVFELVEDSSDYRALTQ